jgi:hypothetical protein
MCGELIVLRDAGFARRARQNTGTEFLKVRTYPVEGETAAALGYLIPVNVGSESPLARGNELSHFFD